MATTYSKQPIALYSQAPLCLFGATVLVSTRRKAVNEGTDPSVKFRNDKTKDGKPARNPQYDYLMVQVNNIVYKFAVSLTEANKSQQALIDSKDSEGKFLPLKFSGLIIPKNGLLENGEPQTMQITSQTRDPESGKMVTEKIDCPIIEAKVEGLYVLSIAATTSIVNQLLGGSKPKATATPAEETPEFDETEEVYEPEPEEPKPAPIKKPVARK